MYKEIPVVWGITQKVFKFNVAGRHVHVRPFNIALRKRFPKVCQEFLRLTRLLFPFGFVPRSSDTIGSRPTKKRKCFFFAPSNEVWWRIKRTAYKKQKRFKTEKSEHVGQLRVRGIREPGADVVARCISLCEDALRQLAIASKIPREISEVFS